MHKTESFSGNLLITKRSLTPLLNTSDLSINMDNTVPIMDSLQNQHTKEKDLKKQLLMHA